MIQNIRQDRIVEYLETCEFLTVEIACGEFEASPATIRRYFTQLAKNGLVERFHGGIKKTSDNIGILPYSVREGHYIDIKRNLANRACSILKNEQTLFVDGGSTVAQMGKFFGELDLRVVSNSLKLAGIIEESGADNVDFYMTGGFLYRKSGILLGSKTVEYLSDYHADYAFLSCAGINSSGISNTNELVTETERVMISNADKVVIVADHSKLNQNSMCRISKLEEIDILICDKKPDAEFITALKDADIELILA